MAGLNKERAKVREKSEEVGLGVLKWGEGGTWENCSLKLLQNFGNIEA